MTHGGDAVDVDAISVNSVWWRLRVRRPAAVVTVNWRLGVKSKNLQACACTNPERNQACCLTDA
jgi:hypothetical protein